MGAAGPSTPSTVAPARTVLFQSHNRRGLGHLMRALNLAREVHTLEPDTRIVLHTRNRSAAAFCPQYVEWLDGAEQDRGHWHRALDSVVPDVVVYDTMIPAEPEAEPIPDGARVAYIMRRCTDEQHAAIAASPFLRRVDVGVIPHESDEFGHAVPAAVADRTVFVGPIVRSPEPATVERLRHRYGLDGARRIVVSCAGGGGFVETAEPFFDAVWNAHERMAATIPGLRHVVVLGPHNTDGREALPGMTVLDSEPDLVGLFAVADLVVSEGGYNSVNELRLVGTPACFIPGRRKWDDQAERVQALAARGLAVVVPPGDVGATGRAVAALAADANRLSELRMRNAQSPLRPGNRRAALAILGEPS